MKKNAFKDSLTIIDTYYNSLADLAVNNKRLNSIKNNRSSKASIKMDGKTVKNKIQLIND